MMTLTFSHRPPWLFSIFSATPFFPCVLFPRRPSDRIGLREIQPVFSLKIRRNDVRTARDYANNTLLKAERCLRHALNVSRCRSNGQRLDYHEGLRQWEIVGYRQADHGAMPFRRHRLKTLGSPSCELHGRLATRQVDHAHVFPEDTIGEPRSQCLRTGLLGRKPLGIGFRPVLATFRLADLDLG